MSGRPPPIATGPDAGASPAALLACLEARGRGPVERIETRTSWVFLTSRLALKLKKPLDLGFLDFTRIEARRGACEEELRLNRRFSNGIYRRVIPVRGTPAAPRFDGAGEPIDHLVCMRRFPPGALLSERIEKGSLSAACVERVAIEVAHFHRRAVVARRSIPFGWPQQVLRSTLDVLERLPGDDPRVPRLRAWVESQAWSLWDLWKERRQGGFVRECHGDLHLANVAILGDTIVPFDCLEFDPALRWTDVMGDVAFLAMDLDAAGRPDLAFRFLDAYLAATGDFDGLRVLRFQLVHRALVRALAHVGEAQDASGHYLDAAWRWSRSACPRLMITHGLSGSGKSCATLELLQRAGAVRLRSDVERARLNACEGEPASPRGRRDPHSPAADGRVRERLLAGVRFALAGGFPVIVDATFLREADRSAFRRLARSEGVPFSLLHCQAEVDVLRARIEARQRQGGDPSDATAAVLERQRGLCEPLTVEERAVAFVVRAGEPPDLAGIARRWLAQPVHGAALTGIDQCRQGDQEAP